MKVQGRRASLGSTFIVPPNPDPRARLCELEKQKVTIEAEIRKAASECLELAKGDRAAATRQIGNWEATLAWREAEVLRLEGMVSDA